MTTMTTMTTTAIIEGTSKILIVRMWKIVKMWKKRFRMKTLIRSVLVFLALTGVTISLAAHEAQQENRVADVELTVDVSLLEEPSAEILLAEETLAEVPLAEILLTEEAFLEEPSAAEEPSAEEVPPLEEPSAAEEVPPLEEPLAEVLLAEEALAEVPLAEEALAEVPLAEEALAEVPLAEVPLAEVPLAEVPLAEEALAEVPLAEVPLAEVPLAEEALAEVPLAEVPLAEEALAEEALAEEEAPPLEEAAKPLLTREQFIGNPDYMLNLDLSTGGRVVAQLFPDVAPLHVERIKQLARSGFYNGVKFHRVIEGFMAQTGDPTATGAGGSSLPDLKAEFNQIPHLRGMLSMARAQEEDSANSQFFIMLQPRLSLDERYTVFGRIVSGMQYVDAIQRGEPPPNMSFMVQVSVVADNQPVPLGTPPRD